MELQVGAAERDRALAPLLRRYLPAGLPAAWAALVTEFCFRAATAGFYGALTEAFRRVQPERTALLAAMLVLPAVAHTLEAVVHWLRGTPELLVSLAASAAFTVLSTSFNLFAMRRGALVVGDDCRPLLDDLRTLPRLAAAFVASTARTCIRPLS